MEPLGFPAISLETFWDCFVYKAPSGLRLCLSLFSFFRGVLLFPVSWFEEIVPAYF